MDSFEGKTAVVTGGASGMGRELAVQLVEQGCNVAFCNIDSGRMSETREIAAQRAPSSDVRITQHLCDVSDNAAVEMFRDEVLAQHDIDCVHLVFNNAGIAGGGSFIESDRAQWDRTFDICWGGVYNGARAFVPLLIAADEGVLVNTSSVNGFWASLGPGLPHTAYSAAKFAVKGFTEALLEDFRVNAPHVTAAVVMPGHIGTDIVNNSHRMFGGFDDAEAIRASTRSAPDAAEPANDDDLGSAGPGLGDLFRDTAPMTAAQAVTVILDSVKAGEWRILVGEDAYRLDEAVRTDPLSVYGATGASLFGEG